MTDGPLLTRRLTSRGPTKHVGEKRHQRRNDLWGKDRRRRGKAAVENGSITLKKREGELRCQEKEWFSKRGNLLKGAWQWNRTNEGSARKRETMRYRGAIGRTQRASERQRVEKRKNPIPFEEEPSRHAARIKEE